MQPSLFMVVFLCGLCEFGFIVQIFITLLRGRVCVLPKKLLLCDLLELNGIAVNVSSLRFTDSPGLATWGSKRTLKEEDASLLPG